MWVPNISVWEGLREADFGHFWKSDAVYVHLCNLFLNHLVEIKICMSNYRYSIMYTAKFKLDNFSNLGDMTSQMNPSHEGNESLNTDIYPQENGFKLKKKDFFNAQNRFLRPKIDLSSQFQQFSTEENFYIQIF